MTVTEQLKQEAVRLGFQAVGVARVESDLAPALERRLRHWLASGYEGFMGWMGRDPGRRSDPRLVLPGCRSIIALGMNYYTGHRADEQPGNGRIARYAWGHDYHDVLRARLRRLADHLQTVIPESRCRCEVDTGPVMEKAWAQQAGLGWIGKHSNLVSPEFGSWLLLGEILTTAELEPDQPGTDLCGSCTLCIRACPTGAIPEPYQVDARRCISYLTIELRGPDHEIPQELADRMGNHIFGCDDCLDVCPYNHQASQTAEPAFQPSPMSLSPHLPGLLRMTEEGFTETFRHSPIRRPKFAGFLRNVQIAWRNWQRHHTRTAATPTSG